MSLLDEASLVQIPSGYKEDKLYSIIPSDGSGDLNFSRASSATRVNEQGLIEEVPVNKLTYSEQFDNAAWLKVGGALTANAGVSPNGQTTADRFYIASAAANTRLYANYTFAAKEYTLSIYAKNNGSTDSFRYSFADSGGQSFSPNFTLTNEWQRFEYTFTSAGGSGVVWIVATASDGVGSEIDLLVWGAQLNSGSTAKPYFPTTDRLNVPRIDYTGGGCGSLLLEPQRTNVAVHSDVSSWSLYGTPTVTTNQSFPFASEDSTLIELATGSSFIRLLNVDVSGGTHTASFWAKKSVSSSFLINAGGKTGIFNFDTGAFSSGTSTGTMVALTDGWFKCTMTFLGVSANAQIRIQGVAYPFGAYFFGFQIEAGSYPTSYIPTSGTAVTRIQDSSSTTGLSSVINSTEGVLFVEIAALADDGTNRNIAISDGTTSNRVHIYYSAFSNTITSRIIVGGATVATLNYNTATQIEYNKIAVKYKLNDFSLWVNGIERDLDKSGIVFPANALNLMQFAAGSGNDNFFGKVKQLMVFDTALTDEQLADLTGEAHTTFNSLATFYGYTIL